MSDVEEPPTKVTKIELGMPIGPGQSMVSLEDGQEEWLSEGVMTDDDYNTSHDNSVQDVSQDMIQDENETNENISQFVKETSDQGQEMSIELNLPQDQDSSQLSPTFTQDLSHIAEEVDDAEKSSDIIQENQNINQEVEEMSQETKQESKYISEDAQDILSQVNIDVSQNSEDITQENQDVSQENLDTIQDNTEVIQENEDLSRNVSNATIEDYTTEQAEVEKADEQKDKQSMGSVETTLNNMEQSDAVEKKSVLNSAERNILDELDTFLIRKSSVTAAEDKGSNERSAKNSDADDGHNTDELLEMLGEDDDKKKKKKKTSLKTAPKKASLAQPESSDDEAMFHGLTKITHLKVAKNAVIKTVQKATADDFFESDMSSEEAGSQSNVFHATRSQTVRKVSTNKNAKSLLKPQYSGKKTESNQSTSTPIRTYSRSKPSRGRLAHRENTQTVRQVSAPQKTTRQAPQKNSENSGEPRSLLKVQKVETVESSNEDTFEKDPAETHRLPRPEAVDEEMPSDVDSENSDESFYDELPSSDSSGLEDWFAIDVRAERAADYIPLLGYKAYDILKEEKERVSAKLSQLREGLAVLNESTKRNIVEIESTRRKLDELEGQLSLA